MSSFRRSLANTTALLSLLLCLAVVGLWVRSYWIEDYIKYGITLEGPKIYRWVCYTLGSGHGMLAMERDENYQVNEQGEPWPRVSEVRRRLFGPRWSHMEEDEYDYPAPFGLPFRHYPSNYWNSFYHPGHPKVAFYWAGFRLDWNRWDGPTPSMQASKVQGEFVVGVPYWFVALLLSLWPVIRLRHLITNWRRARRHLCVACGYDLRGSRGLTCPECGGAVARASEDFLDEGENAPSG